jgi:hypothetical protein
MLTKWFSQLLGTGWERRRSPRRRAARRTPRPSARPWLEALESRYAPAVSFATLAGVLLVECDSGANTVTVDHSGTSAVINGTSFADGSYNLIEIFGGAGGTVFNIRANVKPLTVFGAANDVVNLGSASSQLQGIQGTVLLENEPAFNTVNIHDEGDSTGHTATVSTIARSGDTSLGAVEGLGAAEITWDYNDTTAVNINFGSGTSTVNVLGTGVTTNLFNNGAAAINIGSGNNLAGIQGALNLENELSFDTVNINDQADSTDQTPTISTVTRSGDTSLGALDGLASARITWDYSDTMSVAINAGSGNNVYDIEGTGVPTTINAGTGTNIFRVTPTSQLLANITGLLTINGSGADTLEFFDQNNPSSETYTFDAVPSSLSLATVPGFSANFTGMSAVYLQTNGISTVNDSSGSLLVDQTPP